MADRRWTCPNECGEPGKLAPERARKDDTRTYCLPCSERTGRLVRRVCQAAEKKRAARAETRAEKAKRERERERARTLERSIDGARAISVGQPIRTGYYYVHRHTNEVRYDLPPSFNSGVWERRPHAPPYAQIARTIFGACNWFQFMNDFAREAALHGLALVNDTAPGLFPHAARRYLEALPRASEENRSAGHLYNWTTIREALEKDAKRTDRTGVTLHVTLHPHPDARHVLAEVVTDSPLAKLVREDFIRRIRELSELNKEHPLLPIADEFECAPDNFRAHL